MKQTELLKLLEANNVSKNSYDILDKGFITGSDGYLVTKEDSNYCLYYCERGKKELIKTDTDLEKIFDALAQEITA